MGSVFKESKVKELYKMPGKELRIESRAKAMRPPSGYVAVLPGQKWWKIIRWLSQVQLGCSLLMQLSYVAFPSYNFSLALWCLLACNPMWATKFTRLVPLHMIAVSFSVVTDIIWMRLWVSGQVFFDQFCNASAVSIVSCGGASDRFPGCSLNQFALSMLILNLLAKAALVASLQRIHAIPSAQRTKHRALDGSSETIASAPNDFLLESIRDIAVAQDCSRSLSEENGTTFK